MKKRFSTRQVNRILNEAAAGAPRSGSRGVPAARHQRDDWEIRALFSRNRTLAPPFRLDVRIGLRAGREQRLRVGMLGPLEDLLAGS